MKKHRTIHIVILASVALVAFGLRLYRLTAPLADWHSWRQSDTAAVARNYLKFGIDPLRPRYDDLSNIQSGKDNPMGWRMVEFPLYQVFAAFLARHIGLLPIEVWLRLVNNFASSASVFLLGLLLFAVVDPWVGVWAAVTMAVLPYSVFYGRAILPDTFMVFWALLSLVLLAFDRRGVTSTVVFFVAAACGAVALLVKPTAAFLLLPAPYLILRRLGLSRSSCILLAVYSLICVSALYWWRRWILQFPEGIPAYEWLFNGNGIRFKGAWFYWLFAKRLGELILGYWGLILFGFGLVSKPGMSNRALLYLWLAGALAYLIIFASGNVQHDYYQVLLIPMVSSFVGVGIAALLKNSQKGNRLVCIGTATISFAFMITFSWYTVRTYYWINKPEIVEAGRAADTLLPEDAKVIAPYGGDTTFLYQTRRQGWPIGFDIDEKIRMGATHYISVAPADKDGEIMTLMDTYTVLMKNDTFVIIDLTKKQ